MALRRPPSLARVYGKVEYPVVPFVSSLPSNQSIGRSAESSALFNPGTCPSNGLWALALARDSCRHNSNGIGDEPSLSFTQPRGL
jgi:hypothetical protein